MKGEIIRSNQRFALILTFSPWEKEQPPPVSNFAFARPAKSVTGFSINWRRIHSLLEDRAGVRSSLSIHAVF
jgi:hypothetical protein